jgi:hypothetical protein
MLKKIDFKKLGIKTAGIAAGAVGAELLSESVLENVEPKKRGILKIVAGAFLPELMPKALFLGHAGSGVIASGSVELYHAFKPVSGVGTADIQFEEGAYVDTDKVSGDESPIAGSEQSPIAGVEIE